MIEKRYGSASFDSVIDKPLTARQARIVGPLLLGGLAFMKLFLPEDAVAFSPYATLSEGSQYPIVLPNNFKFTPDPMIYEDTDGIVKFNTSPRKRGAYGFYNLTPHQQIQTIHFHSFLTATARRSAEERRPLSFKYPGDPFVYFESKGIFYHNPSIMFGKEKLQVEGVLVRSVKDVVGTDDRLSVQYDNRVFSIIKELQSNAKKQIDNYIITCYPPYLNSGTGANLLVIGLNR